MMPPRINDAASFRCRVAVLWLAFLIGIEWALALPQCQQLDGLTCPKTAGCTLFNNITVCDDSSANCSTYNYGCQSQYFCAFLGLHQDQQCLSNPSYCYWDDSSNSCQVLCANVKSSTQCSSLSPSCQHIGHIRACNPQGQYCVTNYYGCQASSFCNVLPPNKPQQCAKLPHCYFNMTLGSCLSNPGTTGPSFSPSLSTPSPSLSPTSNPSRQPSTNPTTEPSTSPTARPSLTPTMAPSKDPTFTPSFAPSRNPSQTPTQQPTKSPTFSPSFSPSGSPSISPTNLPSRSPSKTPSSRPSLTPSRTPSRRPSKSPSTSRPSKRPSRRPTKALTGKPSRVPTSSPWTSHPSNTPSGAPQTASPSISPSWAGCVAAKSEKQCQLIAGEGQRCEWIAPNICNSKTNKCTTFSYGCQEYGFCNLSLPGYEKQQCTSRAPLCSWNATAGECQTPCQGVPPKAPTTRIMCTSAVFPLNPVSGRLIRFSGTNILDHAGDGIVGHGDIDGDGLNDVVIGSPDSLPRMPNRPGTGSVNIILGSSNWLIRSVSRSQVVLSNAQIRINGTFLEANFGRSVAFADLDGDGFKDLIVAAPYAPTFGRDRTGQVYVFWGRSDFESIWATGLFEDLEALSSEFVLRIPGEFVLQALGSDLATAGDFDGDGIEDVVIGAAESGINGRSDCGEAFIIYGRKRKEFGANPFFLGNASRVLRIRGPQAFAYFGQSVAGGQDVNGDGYSDVIVGAPWAGNPSGIGAAYVVFGRPNFLPLIDLLTDPYMLNHTWNFMAIAGEASVDSQSAWPNFGRAVALLGDVNMDGVDDFAVGAPYFSPQQGLVQPGRLYVFFGRTTPIATVSLSELRGYQGGFVVNGSSSMDWFGYAIMRGVVDFNGDGYPDIVASSPQRTTTVYQGGETAVIFGRCTGFPANLPLRTNWTSDVGTLLSGVRQQESFGTSLASAGDVDGDGRTDLIIGAHYADNERGAAYVVFSC